MKQPCPETRNIASDKADDGEKKHEAKGLFVKIIMDGIPIGRKVDLGSCESYEKLASVVNQLFHELIPSVGSVSAQMDSSGQQSEKPITGLLDGTGEYTLVYEDEEGDRGLVGDVPWRMFVATARKLVGPFKLLTHCMKSHLSGVLTGGLFKQPDCGGVKSSRKGVNSFPDGL